MIFEFTLKIVSYCLNNLLNIICQQYLNRYLYLHNHSIIFFHYNITIIKTIRQFSVADDHKPPPGGHYVFSVTGLADPGP